MNQVNMAQVDGIFMAFMPHDEFGKPVQRSKFEFPYSYDGFVVWQTGNEAGQSSIYSDRLYQQDSKKFDTLVQKHFGNTGQYWDKRKPAAIEAFLQDWFDRPALKLTLIMEYCNWSNGYPVWRFDFV